MAETGGNIVVARVARAFGIRGEVTAEILTDFPERFENLSSVTLRRAGFERTAEIERHRFHKGRVLLKFRGIDTMSDAEPLAGCTVEIPESELYELPADEDVYYDFDLVGCVVETQAGDTVGTVSSVIRGGAGELLEVKLPGGKSALVPFVDGICGDVDVELKRIVVDLPEGLLDL